MERKSEQPDDNLIRENTPHYFAGKIDFYEERISDAHGLRELLQRDVSGHTIYHVWYERDEDGRTVRERFVSKIVGEKPQEGVYVWRYADDGTYAGKDLEK